MAPWAESREDWSTARVRRRDKMEGMRYPVCEFATIRSSSIYDSMEEGTHKVIEAISAYLGTSESKGL